MAGASWTYVDKVDCTKEKMVSCSIEAAMVFVGLRDAVDPRHCRSLVLHWVRKAILVPKSRRRRQFLDERVHVT